MKAKNRGLVIILSILMVLSLCILGISFQARMFLVDTIGNQGIDRTVVNRFLDPVFDEGGIQDMEQLEEVQNFLQDNGAIEEITGKYLDEITKSIAEGTEIGNIDISKELDQLTEGALAYVEENITDTNPEAAEEIKKQVQEKLQEEKEEITAAMEQYAKVIVEDQFHTDAGAQQNSGITTSELGTFLVKIYVFMNGMIFKIVLIVIILLLMFVIHLLSNHMGHGLKRNSISYLVSALIFLLIFQQLGIRIMMELTNRFLGRTLTLDGTPFMITGIIYGVIGVLLLAGGIFMSKGKGRKNDFQI